MAKIVKATQETVTIARSDGKDYELPLSKLSSADQMFVKEWARKNPVQIDYRFDFGHSTTRLGRISNEQNDIEVIQEEWAYVVNVENRSSEDVENLEMRYRVYYSDRQQGSGKAIDKLVNHKQGSDKLGALKRNQRMERRTSPVTLVETKLNGGYYFADGSKSKKQDSLEGI